MTQEEFEYLVSQLTIMVEKYSALDFDNNLEFDDNGNPKSGRTVLVDEDAIFEERLDMLVSVPIEPSQKKDLNLTDDEN